MQDKLLLLHNFLRDIKQAASEEELSELCESCKDKLGADSEEDPLNKLIKAAQSLGKEILYLRSGRSDLSRNKRLAALTEKEKAELAEVEAIIDENRFSYHFQPIVSTSDGSIYSYEALMRPQNDMGLSPFHVLKYAELTGRLRTCLHKILRTSFRQILPMTAS